MKINQDALVNKVLCRLIGEERYYLGTVPIEVRDRELQKGFEDLIYSLIEDDESKINMALHCIRATCKVSIETWKDEFVIEPRDPANDPEND